MAIDDALDSLKKQFESEDRSKIRFFRDWPNRLRRFRFLCDKRSPQDSCFPVKSKPARRIELVLIVIQEQLRRHEDELRSLVEKSEQEYRKRFQEWFELLEDGAKKAEQTRSRERVKRLGFILANSLLMSTPPQADEVEEMMRDATELSESDVLYLGELVRVQGGLMESSGVVPRYQAWSSWPNGFWGEKITDGEIDSVFSKLESLGLVARIAPPNNLNIMANFQNRYALLRKGLQFVEFVKQK